jgi:hypothetical protein
VWYNGINVVKIGFGKGLGESGVQELDLDSATTRQQKSFKKRVFLLLFGVYV